MDITSKESRSTYLTPSMRIVYAKVEFSFLASNLEPIGGGEDPDIDW